MKPARVWMVCLGWTVWTAPTPVSALDARGVDLKTVALDKMRLVEPASCRAGQVWIEEFFRVTGLDPADLLMVRRNGVGEVVRLPVTGVDQGGRLVYGYCAARTIQEQVETRFLSVQGESTPAVTYVVKAVELAVEKEVTPLLGLHQTTRYMQFADSEQPEKKGTCCWHHLYVTYPWHKPMAELSEVVIPMRFDSLLKPEPHHLYYQFYSEINETKFYFGIQTNLKLRGKDHGVGAIFSRWDTQDVADLQTVSGGFHEIGDYEGRFISVRKRFVPETGPMALRLTSRVEKKDPGQVWVDLTLMHQTNGTMREEKIGGLRFPGAVARLTRRLKITVESYSLRSVSKASAWQVPFFDWWLEAPRVNGRAVAVKPEVKWPELAPRVVRVLPSGETGLRIRRTGLMDPDGELNTSEKGETGP